MVLVIMTRTIYILKYFIYDDNLSGSVSYRVKTLENNTAKLHINPSSTQISNYSNGSIWIVTN